MRKLLGTLLLLSISHPAAAATRPVVLELFTSQGCSSCPPADAVISQLAKEPGIIALSFHIDYWDRLGWKDPFSLPESTARQRGYAQLHHDRLYTPQMVIDGVDSMIGFKKTAIESSMASVRISMQSVPISLSADAGGRTLSVHVSDAPSGAYPKNATLWAMRYKKKATTSIPAGENSGRTIENANNVVRITKLGTWDQRAANYDLTIGDLQDDGIAIILQEDGFGAIIGAASYTHGS